MLPSSQDFEKSIEICLPLSFADFYGYNALAKHQQQGFVGPITREEHDLQLWYSGGLQGEPRGRQEPRNLLGSKSYEEYRGAIQKTCLSLNLLRNMSEVKF